MMQSLVTLDTAIGDPYYFEMDIRPITPDYAVSPQIAIEDFAALADAGFTTVICNRPDAENPSTLHAEQMKTAAEAAGMTFCALPLTHQTMTPENIARHAEIIEQSSGPVLAYCASGTRSSIAWALGQSGKRPADEIIAATAKAGYDLSGLRSALA